MNARYTKKPGRSEEEQAAIDAFMKTKKPTICPPVLARGNELKESAVKRYSEMTKEWKKKNKPRKGN